MHPNAPDHPQGVRRIITLMAEDQQQDTTDGITTDTRPPDWGRVIDGLGILAGILLAVIAVDIWTDGRLISRRLNRDKPQQQDTDVDRPA